MSLISQIRFNTMFLSIIVKKVLQSIRSLTFLAVNLLRLFPFVDNLLQLIKSTPSFVNIHLFDPETEIVLGKFAFRRPSFIYEHLSKAIPRKSPNTIVESNYTTSVSNEISSICLQFNNKNTHFIF